MSLADVGQAGFYTTTDGINTNWPHLSRDALVLKLDALFTLNNVARQFVLIASPAGSGKTSLLRLFQVAVRKSVHCILVDMKLHSVTSIPLTAGAVLLNSTGIDMEMGCLTDSSMLGMVTRIQ